MITIELQNYGRYGAFDSGKSIGCISVHRNSFHAQNCYLDLELTQYDTAFAPELFAQLRGMLARPLQVMIHSWEYEKSAFLTAGGFQRRRRCFEMEVGRDDLLTPLQKSVSISEALRGERPYQECCDLLYDSYAKTHEAISPLTADRETFSRSLPDRVLFHGERGKVTHFAFIEENEIAYIGTDSLPGLRPFAETLLSLLFQRHSVLSFECDDCDPAAMELRALFHSSKADSYDTYILE